ncbi:hypothetical protein M426DRAFT_74258 [Hypoxylon sp. CI-4A]|nr:hypothetical protein M426DRAFT_74258 [Hypoxylon sp. CI-4A]
MHAQARVAVRYQALDPPVIGGMRKPRKPGGYQDSGADIAFNLGNCADIDVITPFPRPDPVQDVGWCYPDTEEGILQAVEMGATHIWANTILFASHPLQTSSALESYQDSIRIVGCFFTMPKAWTIHDNEDMGTSCKEIPYPVVAKPVRGRGSQGVKVCYNLEELLAHARALLSTSSCIILEEFLEGEEITTTVMPPSRSDSEYWTLPIVTRFNHEQGVAPYNGVVAVTANSRAIVESELDPTYTQAIEECKQAARVLVVAAPIQIDARRFKESKLSKFALFDVNMKPNMTGPGRPDRDDQASLTLMAACALGWDYQELLRHVLDTSHSLRDLRRRKPI